MREKSPNSKGAEENNQRRSNGRPYGRQPETGDFPPPFTTFVDEADSSGRKVHAMETLNPHVDRMRSSVAVAPSAGAVTSGFHQANLRHHHHQDDASTSSRGLASYLARVQLGNDAIVGRGDEAVVEGFQREMKDLEELLSKLNPMAEEFVPSSLAAYGNGGGYGGGCRYSNAFSFQNRNADANAGPSYRKKSSYGHEKRRMNSRTNLAQRGEVIRRTVYVSDIDHLVTEEQLAALFISCGQVVDCRICGDPNSILRFAFIEFTDEEGARAALGLSGTMLGYYPVRVLPSKTAIAPVNPTFLPRSEDEREMCARTVYCTNIDKKVTQVDLKLFFESLCGEVYRLRLLGDHHYSTRIAFIEFVQADSATAALNCSGATLGSQPIRVSPSKTPVRPRLPRYSGHQA